MSRKVLVTGAGGFIGHHLVSYLKDRTAETCVAIAGQVVSEELGTTVGVED